MHTVFFFLRWECGEVGTRGVGDEEEGGPTGGLNTYMISSVCVGGGGGGG